jgi:F0F1-type ATP synthase epsilon subunit
MLKDSILTVTVRNKDKVLYSGQAFAVTAVNDRGPFDVLAQHESFISLIKNKVTIRSTPTEKREIQIENGIIRVYKDKVYIYVNFSS